MAMAMAGSRVGNLECLRSFCEVRGFVRKEVGFSDRSHESFYALRVRCGKKAKNLAVKLAKVQELVKVQRELVLLSQKVSTEQEVCEPIGDNLQPEDSIQIAISNPKVSTEQEVCEPIGDNLQLADSIQIATSNPNVLERIIKNLENLQAEVESLNVKAKKKKSGSSSSSSSSSESSDGDMGEAVDMRALRKNKNFAKHTWAPVALAGQNSASDNSSSSISVAPVETLASAHVVTEAMSSVMLPPFHLAERIAAALSTSDDVKEEEPAIVAQIRALCSTANSAPASTREIYSRGPIELRDTSGGRVIMDTTSSSFPSLVIPVSRDVVTGCTIEVCTVGKCKRGGSQQILASLLGCIPESSSISVTSCKCMGKCKSAPNVRVKNSEGQTQLHSYVSMDDIDTLLELHFSVQSSASQSSAMPIFFAGIDSGVAAA